MADTSDYGDWTRPALPLLLLRFLIESPAHGYGLVERLRAVGIDARGATVYPQLSKLQDAGCITSRWQTPDIGPARKVLTITETGKRHHRDLQHQWSDFNETLTAVLDALDTPSGREDQA